MVIRGAAKGDLAAIRSLLAESDLPTGGVDEDSLGGFSVGESPDGSVLACAAVEVHGDSGLLRSVAVRPAMRGSGIGRQLARDRVAWSRERRLARLFLLTTTAPGFFERLGFAATDRALVDGPVTESAEFRDLCPASAVVMTLRLNPDR